VADLDQALAAPTVIVDDVHVTYRVQGVGGGSVTPGSDAVSALRRIIRRGPAPGVQYIKAVRGVSFVAREGDAIGLIGRNGSGKSTLLQAIAGLLPTASGRIFTSAQPSLLGVNAALLPQLTGERNIERGQRRLQTLNHHPGCRTMRRRASNRPDRNNRGTRTFGLNWFNRFAHRGSKCTVVSSLQLLQDCLP